MSQVFGWYEGPGKNYTLHQYIPTTGPHRTLASDGKLHRVKEEDRKHTHSLEEILSFGWSDTQQKKIKSAKVGTIIQITTEHSIANLYIKRLSDEEIELFGRYNEQIAALAAVEKEILEKTQDLQVIRQELIRTINSLPYGKKFKG